MYVGFHAIECDDLKAMIPSTITASCTSGDDAGSFWFNITDPNDADEPHKIKAVLKVNHLWRDGWFARETGSLEFYGTLEVSSEQKGTHPQVMAWLTDPIQISPED